MKIRRPIARMGHEEIQPAIMSAIARQDIPFNKSVLKWARERHGRSREQAAKRAGVTPEKITEWESEASNSMPTVRQARLLAQEYQRPFLEFFAKEIPNMSELELVPDFRLYAGAPNQQENRALLDVQEWAETQRLNAIDLFEILGDAPPKFPASLYANLKSSPSDIAARAREVAKFPFSEQLGLNSAERDRLPKKLRTRFEALGVLVLKNSSLKKLRARGLCIFFDVLPVIVLGNEAPSAQAFTIVHEIGHIILKQSAVIGALPSEQAISSAAKIEQWCNRFAGAFLAPAEILADKLPKPLAPKRFIEDTTLSALATHFGVSRHAMLIRLIELGYVEPDYYWRVKRLQFQKEEDAYEAFGRSTYYGARYRSSLGDLYTGLVLEAWATGRITNYNAGEFMGIKNLTHLNELRDHFGV